MNETIRQLFDRKSVRVFTDQPITPTEKQLILEAATQAPTPGNQQLYTILDITDQAIKEKLVSSCDDQPFIAEAQLVLVFCADCLKWYNAFLSAGCGPRDPGVGDLMLAVSDANIAAQNAVVAAQSMGIGSCYIGDIMENYELQKEILQIPRYVFPCAMLVFGYPTEQQLRREKPKRAALSHIVHENSYRVMEQEELQEMLSKNTATDYNAWIQGFCKRKYNSAFSREMTRSVARYLTEFANKEPEA